MYLPRIYPLWIYNHNGWICARAAVGVGVGSVPGARRLDQYVILARPVPKIDRLTSTRPPGKLTFMSGYAPAGRTVARLGRRVRAVGREGGARVGFVGRVARAPFELPRGSWYHTRRVVVQQLLFTATHGLRLVVVIGVLVGATVILQAYEQAVRLGVPHMPARLLVTIVIRELGPLITAMVVLGRSGTAIAAEMASNTVLGETEALEAMGVDPVHVFVLPRVLGLALSAVLLTIYFDATAFASGILAARLLADVPVADSLGSLRLVLASSDILITFVKALTFGAGIAIICGRTGLSVRVNQPTDVPRAVTRAVVASLLFIFVASALVTLIMYT